MATFAISVLHLANEAHDLVQIFRRTSTNLDQIAELALCREDPNATEQLLRNQVMIMHPPDAIVFHLDNIILLSRSELSVEEATIQVVRMVLRGMESINNDLQRYGEPGSDQAIKALYDELMEGDYVGDPSKKEINMKRCAAYLEVYAQIGAVMTQLERKVVDLIGNKQPNSSTRIVVRELSDWDGRISLFYKFKTSDWRVVEACATKKEIIGDYALLAKLYRISSQVFDNLYGHATFSAEFSTWTFVGRLIGAIWSVELDDDVQAGKDVHFTLILSSSKHTDGKAAETNEAKIETNQNIVEVIEAERHQAEVALQAARDSGETVCLRHLQASLTSCSSIFRNLRCIADPQRCHRSERRCS